MEIVVFKALDQQFKTDPRFAYQGAFDLEQPKNASGRFKAIKPPKNIGKFTTTKEADFFQFGHSTGPLCIECKNYREWLYPHNDIIKHHIIRCVELNAIPVFVYRRIHYTTKTNFLEPAGIIAHESYYQYYPSDKADLAALAQNKRSLGFTDIVATEDPHPRTIKFFHTTLPKLVDTMAPRWLENRDALFAYATGEINLAQLYTEIGSPSGGKWQDFSSPDYEPDPPEY